MDRTWEDVLKFVDANYDTVPALKETLRSFLRTAMEKGANPPSEISGGYYVDSYDSWLPFWVDLDLGWEFNIGEHYSDGTKMWSASVFMNEDGTFTSATDHTCHEGSIMRTECDEWFFDGGGHSNPATPHVWPVEDEFWSKLMAMHVIDGVTQYEDVLHAGYP